MSALPGFDDANLILRLYELRREEKLRAAREWFATRFFPETADDINALFLPGDERGTWFRMVVSYWDMAASFAVRGPLNPELLLESSGELCLVWARIEKVIPDLRAMIKLPEYLRNIEEIIERVDWAGDRVRWLRERSALQKAQAQKTA
jgi:hypothetical protein